MGIDILSNANNLSVFSIVRQIGFVVAALVFNMCVEAYGLIVINTTSIRGHQVLQYAILSCILVDISLALGGRTRFVGDIVMSVVPPAVTDLLGSLPRLWVHPSLSFTLKEALSIVLLKRVIQKLKQTKGAS